MHVRLPSLLLLTSMALVGCSENETLYTGLSQTEANKMLSLMYASGLSGQKSIDDDNAYQVTTPLEDFSAAMTLLERYGLPGEQFESMGDVFEKEGFVSSRLEERARFNFALSQEIARTISSIDGVVMARVHLVIPARERLSKDVLPASASVFVKHRSDVDLSGAVSRIKSIVINGVERLPYQNVTVALFETSPPTVTGAQPVVAAVEPQ